MGIEIGAYNKLPHYAVIGPPTAFYVWVNEDGRGVSSNWITGSNAFNKWHLLKRYKAKDKAKFVSCLKELFLENEKST